MVSGFGKLRATPGAVDDGHVVRQEATLAGPEQLEHRAGLAGVGPGRQHQPPAVDVHARGVEEHVAPVDEDEAEQGLDHVGVEDVRAPGQGPAGRHRDVLTEVDGEVGRQAPKCSSHCHPGVSRCGV